MGAQTAAGWVGAGQQLATACGGMVVGVLATSFGHVMAVFSKRTLLPLPSHCLPLFSHCLPLPSHYLAFKKVLCVPGPDKGRDRAALHRCPSAACPDRVRHLLRALTALFPPHVPPVVQSQPSRCSGLRWPPSCEYPAALPSLSGLCCKDPWCCVCEDQV